MHWSINLIIASFFLLNSLSHPSSDALSFECFELFNFRCRLLNIPQRATPAVTTDMRRCESPQIPLHLAKCFGGQIVLTTNTVTAQDTAGRKQFTRIGAEKGMEVRANSIGNCAQNKTVRWIYMNLPFWSAAYHIKNLVHSPQNAKHGYFFGCALSLGLNVAKHETSLMRVHIPGD